MKKEGFIIDLRSLELEGLKAQCLFDEKVDFSQEDIKYISLVLDIALERIGEHVKIVNSRKD